jgi:hypothetical protein
MVACCRRGWTMGGARLKDSPTNLVTWAGGHVSHFDGRPLRSAEPAHVVASNGAIRAELLRVVDSQFVPF